VSGRESGGIGSILTTRRIEALTDGIFGFAMTLLVTTIALPSLASTSDHSIRSLVLGQWHQFYVYGLSFMLLSVFWVVHHIQFHVIERTDGLHVWINIVLLMFVALIPFSCDLAGDYPGEPVAEMVFGLNMLAVGGMYLLNWVYATGSHRLVSPDLPRAAVVTGLRRTAVVPVTAVVAMGVAFVAPGWATMAYLLIPVLLSLPYFRRY